MRSFILCALLCLTGTAARLQAQEQSRWEYEKTKTKTKAEAKFSMPERDVNIRDFVALRKSNRMVIELTTVKDFDRIRNLDVLLLNFRRDIAFYKDSLESAGSGNVRIDYAVEYGQNDMSEIRFKKYAPDGDVYVNKRGSVAHLKLDQDTVRFIIHVPQEKSTNKRIRIGNYNIQVSFYLNSYTDVDSLLADKPMLAHIVDTLVSIQGKGVTNRPARHPSSAVYAPYSYGSQERLIARKNYVMTNAYDRWQGNSAPAKLVLGGNVGAGLIRNTFAPYAEFKLSFLDQTRAGKKDNSLLASLGVSPYFFFERDAERNYHVYDNWFVNLEIGESHVNTPDQSMTMGVGYLFAGKGDYFKGTTMKLFMTVQLKPMVTISPEIIFTNDFKQVFPGITIKVF